LQAKTSEIFLKKKEKKEKKKKRKKKKRKRSLLVGSKNHNSMGKRWCIKRTVLQLGGYSFNP